MYYVYILKSERNQRFYTGLTKNVVQRLADHNGGRVRPTKSGRPWKLMYQEKSGTREEARKREKYFKSGAGREYRDYILPP